MESIYQQQKSKHLSLDYIIMLKFNNHKVNIPAHMIL